VFRKYRSDKVSALGEINSKNRGIITGRTKVYKIIIHFSMTAQEYCSGGALLASFFIIILSLEHSTSMYLSDR
jgi:hypothetical protein